MVLVRLVVVALLAVGDAKARMGCRHALFVSALAVEPQRLGVATHGALYTGGSGRLLRE